MSDTATKPKARIATIKGTWIKPGMSLNNRLYTAEHISAAAEEAQSSINSGNGPRVFSMLTHHGARKPEMADVTKTAGRVTKIGVDNRGYGTFEAELADTQAGRDVAALVTPAHPYLKGVSMASVWKSAPKQVQVGGTLAETADDGFSLRGIDFTHDPGVPEGAQITHAQIEEDNVTEDVLLEAAPEDAVVEADTTPKAPYGNVTYADPGYQKDKKKRYPIDTKAHIRSAWAYINKAGNAAKYSSDQVARIKGKIKRAAKGQGINIAEDIQMFGTEIMEAYVAMSASNGPGDVSVSAYGVDGSDVGTAARIVGMAAIAALAQLDPDMDGDLDLDRFDDDANEADSECPNCGQSNPDGTNYCPACGTSLIEEAPEPATEGGPGTKEGLMPTDADKTGGAPQEAELTDREKMVAEAAAKAATAAAYEAIGLNADGTPKPVEESDELKAARALIAEADKGKAPGTPTPAPTPAPVEAAPFDPAALVAQITEANAKANEEFQAKVIEEMRRAPQRKGMVPRSILEESPEDVYGGEPGERGVNLRGKSLRDLEGLADDAFTPLISANA